ncbi:hypothetical protein GCM10010347_65470 [Streptomyces cirratus]|uniref:Uncharacterized protein n=1 Tax=Streptomyces cirratus TaxID=68187 RepID=A0ABQ3F5I2_9ACTN|nr:hypothetical protein GCM10010347_65470 [Streptomyces cirratus]
MALDPGRGDALLDEAGVVDNEHPAVLTEMPVDIGLEVVVTDAVCVPVCPVQQPRGGSGSGVAEVLEHDP